MILQKKWIVLKIGFTRNHKYLPILVFKLTNYSISNTFILKASFCEIFILLKSPNNHIIIPQHFFYCVYPQHRNQRKRNTKYNDLYHTYLLLVLHNQWTATEYQWQAREIWIPTIFTNQFHDFITTFSSSSNENSFNFTLIFFSILCICSFLFLLDE